MQCNLIRQNVFGSIKNLNNDGKVEIILRVEGLHFNSIGRTHVTVNIDETEYPLNFKIVPKKCILFPSKWHSSYIQMITVVKEKYADIFKDVNLKFVKKLKEIIKNYKSTGIKKSPVKMKMRLKDETSVSQNPRRLAEHNL